MEPALLWLAGTVRGEVGVHKIFNGTSITVVGSHDYGRGGAHKIFHGASITIVRWHGYGRVRGPTYISWTQHYCGCLGPLWMRSWLIRYFRDPALLCLAGKIVA